MSGQARGFDAAGFCEGTSYAGKTSKGSIDTRARKKQIRMSNNSDRTLTPHKNLQKESPQELVCIFWGFNYKTSNIRDDRSALAGALESFVGIYCIAYLLTPFFGPFLTDRHCGSTPLSRFLKIFSN